MEWQSSHPYKPTNMLQDGQALNSSTIIRGDSPIVEKYYYGNN